MKDKTMLYLTALIIYVTAVVNKPQDIEQSNMKSTSTKYTKNWPQDIISGVAIRKALISKNQSQELSKEGINL